MTTLTTDASVLAGGPLREPVFEGKCRALRGDKWLVVDQSQALLGPLVGAENVSDGERAAVVVSQDGTPFVAYPAAGAAGPAGPAGPLGPAGPQGAAGTPGAAGHSAMVYEQPGEPLGAVPGDVWVDTDAPVPIVANVLTYRQLSALGTP